MNAELDRLCKRYGTEPDFNGLVKELVELQKATNIPFGTMLEAARLSVVISITRKIDNTECPDDPDSIEALIREHYPWP